MSKAPTCRRHEVRMDVSAVTVSATMANWTECLQLVVFDLIHQGLHRLGLERPTAYEATSSPSPTAR
jgi:hypothetical protein